MYMFKRGGIYYFRIVLDGKDVRLSLSTSSKRIAQIKTKEILQRLYMIRYKGYTDVKPFINDIQNELNLYLSRATEPYSALENSRFEDLKKFDKETISTKIDHYKELVFDIDKRKQLSKEAKKIASRDEILKDIETKLTTEEKNIFYELLIKTQREVLKADLDNSENFTDLNKNIIQKPKTYPKSADEKIEAFYNLGKADKTKDEHHVIGADDFTFLDEVFGRYETEYFGHFDRHTVTEHKASYRLLKRVLLELGYTLPFNNAEIIHFGDIIDLFPMNFTKLSDEIKNLSLIELTELTRTGKLQKRQLTTLQKQKQQINAFLKYLEEQYNLDQKYLPSSKSRVINADKRNKKANKVPFSDAELELIFAEVDKQKLKYPERYWLIWIHLFTGMRSNEIGQLRIKDLKQHPTNKIWYFNVTDEDVFQKLKDKGIPKRKIPVHSFLVELGLLKHRAERLKELKDSRNLLLPIYNKNNKTTPLLDLTKPPNKDFSEYVSVWFSDMLKEIGIKRANLTLYSLRHTFKEAMANVPINIVSEIMGHTASGTTEGIYGLEKALSIKQENIEKIWFETFQYKNYLKK